MKIAGGALMTRENAFRTLVRRGRFGPFADLNAARKLFTALPGLAACDLNDFGRGGETVRRVLLTALLTAWDSGGVPPEARTAYATSPSVPAAPSDAAVGTDSWLE